MNLKVSTEEANRIIDFVTDTFDVQLKDLADVVGKNYHWIRNVRRGSTKITQDQLQLIIDHFKIDGKETFSFVEDNESLVNDPSEKYSKKIPFYETDAFATISPSMQGAIPITPKTFHYIPFLSDAEMSIMVTGNSMKGYINHGDHVAIKRILDVDRIIYGECYFIVTRANNLKTVKFLNEHDDPNLLWLSPYNVEQFQSQAIEKTDILELYQVKAILRPISN